MTLKTIGKSGTFADQHEELICWLKRKKLNSIVTLLVFRISKKHKLIYENIFRKVDLFFEENSDLGDLVGVQFWLCEQKKKRHVVNELIEGTRYSNGKHLKRWASLTKAKREKECGYILKREVSNSWQRLQHRMV